MVYRVTHEEAQKQGEEFRVNYPPFKPFQLSENDREQLANSFMNVFTTQNGADFDDYSMTDASDKTQRYLPNLPKGSKILLLGTGTGREVLAAKSAGYQAVGTTFGSRNVEFGKRYLGLSDEELLECCNEALPFKGETFDAVVGYQIFEHTMAPLIFLLEQSRVLKFGGKLMLEWPPPDNYTGDDNPHHQVCFIPGQAHGLFRKSGFSEIKLYYDDLQPIPEDRWWSGVSDKMFCIEGIKTENAQHYVRKVWGK